MLSFSEKTIIVFNSFEKLLTFKKLLTAKKFLIFKKLLTFEELLTIEKFLIFRKLLTLFKSFNKAITAFNVFDNEKVNVIINLSIIRILRQCSF